MENIMEHNKYAQVPICENCIYSISTINVDMYGKVKPQNNRFCRRMPPTGEGFPKVENSWWCGEYKEAEIPENSV